jgi:hypothetical protein
VQQTTQQELSSRMFYVVLNVQSYAERIDLLFSKGKLNYEFDQKWIFVLMYFSIDELDVTDFANTSSNVMFSQPVPLYTDDFLGFPVGTPVPVGMYLMHFDTMTSIFVATKQIRTCRRL